LENEEFFKKLPSNWKMEFFAKIDPGYLWGNSAGEILKNSDDCWWNFVEVSVEN